MSALAIFLIGMGLQQGSYEFFHEGCRFEKSDAILMSAVVVGVGGTLYYSMDIPNTPAYNSQVLAKAKYHWSGQLASIGLTLSIGGL